MPELQSMIKKEGTWRYLSSEELLKNDKKSCVKYFTTPVENVRFNSHGPCITCLVYNLKGISEKVEHDMANGIECLSWPVASTESIYRPRLMGWPSKEIVKEIDSFPVHVMPVGDPKSNISSMQWHFAFS